MVNQQNRGYNSVIQRPNPEVLTTQPLQQSPIDQDLADLEVAVNRLCHHADALANKTVPIRYVGPSPEGASDKTSNPPSSCALSDRIRSQTHTLNSVGTSLATLIDSLQI